MESTTFTATTQNFNITELGSPQTGQGWIRYALTAAFIAVIIFTILGNLTTVIAVRIDKQLRSLSNLYIASLATADLIVGALVMTVMLVYTVISDGVWTLGPFACDAWTFVDYVACTASLTNVCVIAEDRFQAVAKPLKTIGKRTKRRSALLVGCAWALPAVFWATMTVYLRNTSGRPPMGECHLLWDPPHLALIAASATVYLPIIVILTLFISIMVVLKRNMIAMEHNMRRSHSMKGRPVRKTRRFRGRRNLTSDEAGGISFNPRFTDRDIQHDTDKKRGLDEQRQDTTSDMSEPDEYEAYYSTSIQQEKERLGRPFYRRGRLFRSVSTSTSPERYGLVRTVGTNTHPGDDDADQATSVTVAVQTDAPIALEPDASDDNRVQAFDGVSSTSGVCSDSDSTIKTLVSPGSSVRRVSSLTAESDSDLDIIHSPIKRRYASLLREKRHSHMEKTRLKQQLSAAKTLGTIMTFLLLCWLPFAILWPLRVFCKTCVSQFAYNISIWINYLNSSINPIIYCLCNPKFKRAFQRILTRRTS